ncbi:TOM1-like protein 1 isoform X1 [Physcomitrium patens]|uniref:VHS domain-containing protein n=1 Tax=Physcomitrium patens TaxID=3218 RepID=A0A7I4CYX3_PHYPA|nr:TOM1-like protein 1 isoform X1 [Physcomitrium patens]XP_024368263.1 TOM1-like protein 1 isoform X1 [Physcomitrium patens]XP_024368264.1 TOM1-like protein 1 isoform X1 [Physcomitrium patens]|eukprot:XP_024368262.1 TOM1-like protein 1 isoform X1 [Physcomitrella patens]
METANLKEKFSAFGEKVKTGSGELSRKMSERMSTVSDKMKELFQVPTHADKLVEDATGENMELADWEKNLEICDLISMEKVSGQDAARAVKKRIMLKNAQIQYLALMLLETMVKNCEKMFSEVASEKVLHEMVRMVDDRSTSTANREKALKLIEAWGESTEELRYLPIFEETYKSIFFCLLDCGSEACMLALLDLKPILYESLKSRGIRFPGRDEESLAPIFTPPQSVQTSNTAGSGGFDGSVHSRDMSGFVAHDVSSTDFKEVFDVARNSVELLNTVLTSSPQQEVLKDELTLTLVEQCRSCQIKVQRIVERTSDGDPVLFEALNVYDDLQRVLTKFEEMSKGTAEQPQPAEATFVHVQALDDDYSCGTAEEATLVRKRDSKPSIPLSSAHDDTAMADLDEMIFGNRSEAEGSRQKSKKQNADDLIMF